MELIINKIMSYFDTPPTNETTKVYCCNCGDAFPVDDMTENSYIENDKLIIDYYCQNCKDL